MHDIFVHNNNNNSNKCLRTHVFNSWTDNMNHEISSGTRTSTRCIAAIGVSLAQVPWLVTSCDIHYFSDNLMTVHSLLSSKHSEYCDGFTSVAMLSGRVWASIIQCDCTVGSRAAPVVNLISLSNMSHMLPFWKRNGSCHSLFDLFGTCNLRLFRVPTVPEEMKFAKYPSACGEDLHLKFQTRAWASEPPSLRAGFKVDSLAHWAWLLRKFWRNSEHFWSLGW